MRQLSIYSCILILLITVSSCTDEPLKNDPADQGQRQLLAQQRSEFAQTQLQTDKPTRWDAPWWDMSDEDMADSLRATNGEVIISFKEPGQNSGVDIKGRVLVSEQTVNSGIEAIIELGACATFFL